jgi:hypothetical protein
VEFHSATTMTFQSQLAGDDGAWMAIVLGCYCEERSFNNGQTSVVSYWFGHVYCTNSPCSQLVCLSYCWFPSLRRETSSSTVQRYTNPSYTVETTTAVDFTHDSRLRQVHETPDSRTLHGKSTKSYPQYGKTD